jgi:hypothetical protein
MSKNWLRLWRILGAHCPRRAFFCIAALVCAGGTSAAEFCVAIGGNHSGNSFDVPRTTSDAHFLSLDETLLTAPRLCSGELPETLFMRLAKDNPLIDTGVSCGMPFNGIAPDPGAFESR